MADKPVPRGQEHGRDQRLVFDELIALFLALHDLAQNFLLLVVASDNHASSAVGRVTTATWPAIAAATASENAALSCGGAIST